MLARKGAFGDDNKPELAKTQPPIPEPSESEEESGTSEGAEDPKGKKRMPKTPQNKNLNRFGFVHRQRTGQPVKQNVILPGRSSVKKKQDEQKGTLEAPGRRAADKSAEKPREFAYRQVPLKQERFGGGATPQLPVCAQLDDMKTESVRRLKSSDIDIMEVYNSQKPFEASDPERNQPRPPHVKQFGFKSRDSSRLQSHYANELEKLGVAHHHHQSAQESPHKNGTQKGGVYESSAYSKSEFRG